MEGITGVVHWDQVDPSNSEYGRLRRVMTGDVNAAIRGACDGGAEMVIVADGHGSGRNILIEELDPRAHLNCGSPSPLAMVQGADSGVSAAMFVGYHARVGSPNAILDHTWSSSCVANVWLNGRLMGEIGMNAAVCGQFGVPVILVTGDQTACAEAAELLGPVETAVVKQASGRMAAECLPPEMAQAKIQAAACLAVRRFVAGQSPVPMCLEQPVRLVIEWVGSEMADRATLLPNALRREGKQVEYSAVDALDAYRTMRAAVAVARA
jgi:D-amino peptidase